EAQSVLSHARLERLWPRRRATCSQTRHFDHCERYARRSRFPALLLARPARGNPGLADHGRPARLRFEARIDGGRAAAGAVCYAVSGRRKTAPLLRQGHAAWRIRPRRPGAARIRGVCTRGAARPDTTARAMPALTDGHDAVT